MGINSLRDIVSKETIARLDKKVSPAEVDKLLLSIAETILSKDKENSDNQNLKPVFKIHLDTDEGVAVIASRLKFNTLGSYRIYGPGRKAAREWIEGEGGAFGNTIGTYAAPCDLHCAAMRLQQEPEPHIRFLRFEGCVETYDSGVPEGSVS